LACLRQSSNKGQPIGRKVYHIQSEEKSHQILAKFMIDSSV
jgi:hypothetical protein